MKKAFIILSIIALILISASFATLSIIFLIPSKIELSSKKLFKSSNYTNYYDYVNEKIDICLYDNSLINIDEIAPHTINAFIAVEDKNFYKHNGIDIKRMAAAAINNLKSFSYSEGASTITQQLIKNTHLSSKKTISRKIDEIKLAIKAENIYSKNQILEAYLNTIYFGENCYGLNSASKRYFNKTAAELNLQESAMLAAIIVAPSRLNAYKNFDALNSRKNLVLSLMKNQNYINDSELILAKNAEIKLNYLDNYDNSYSYIKAVNSELNEISKLSPYDFKNCSIYTHFDKSLQNKLIEEIPLNDCDYKAIVIDNASNGVSAYYSTCGNFNRQPASTIKPLLVYAPAFENNIVSPLTTIIDEKTSFNGYSPSNYNDKYYGNVSIKSAIALSLNIPAVKIYDSIGAKKAKSYIEKMNLTINSDTLSAALGGFDNGINFIDLVNAYTVFPNSGQYKNIRFISKVTDENGKIIYNNESPSIKVFSNGTATLINDCLKETINCGTAKKLSGKKYELAAKTGTNGDKSGNLDTYSIAYTSKHSLGVWLGNDDNSKLPNSVTGGNQPTATISKILDYLYRDTTPPPFNNNGVIVAGIDKEIYNSIGDVVLADNNAPDRYVIKAMFLENNLPTKTDNSFSMPQAENTNILVENNLVKISYKLKEYQSVKIYKSINNVESLVYSGNDNYIDKIDKNGTYQYYITTISHGKDEIEGKKIYLPKVFVENNTKEDILIEPDNWWNNCY